MAFVQRNVLRSASKFHQIIRPLSGGAAQKSVFISQSNDVYTNLALEEWIKSNYDLNKDNIMLYYKNDPCIQIGQTANPWLETNISFHHENDNVLPVARKQGQASTVYQDNGAMNLSIFGRSATPNDIVARALFRRFGLIVNKQKDGLRFFDHKISADQVAEGEDYQHCSLFVDVNQGDSVGALTKQKVMYADPPGLPGQSGTQINSRSLANQIAYENKTNKSVEFKERAVSSTHWLHDFEWHY